MLRHYPLLNHAGDFSSAAKALTAMGYGTPPSKPTAKPAPATVESPPQNAVTVVDVIREHLVKRYSPTFRRGADIYAGNLGRVITRGEACGAPTSDIIEPVMAAKDYSRGQDGPIRARFPSTYKQWAPVAWADLLAALPDEADSPEMAASAAEQFQGIVADALMTIECFSYKHKDGKEERSEVQRRSLIDWCRQFAKPGNWKSIRSLSLWVKLDEDNQLQIALHQRLFSQIRRGHLAPPTHRQFADLCELYSVGKRGGTSTSKWVELTPEFLADLTSHPGDGRCDGEGDGSPLMRTRGCVTSQSPSHAPSRANDLDDVAVEPQ